MDDPRMNSLILQVTRTSTSETGTLGYLMAYVNGAMVYKCNTLEDPVRQKGIKVWGDTAIPEGTYPVAVRFSNRFQKELPGISDVPGFSGVLCHGGNTKADTRGCILLGTQLQSLNPPRIGICAPAVSKVIQLLKDNGNSATLQIVSAK